MKHYCRRKCKHCGKLYQVNPRRCKLQTYCGEKICQQVSHAASQRRWLAKPDNQDPHRASDAVIRVQAWRKAHPGYWRRCRKRPVALHDESAPQPIDIKEDKSDLTPVALHDVIWSQHTLLVGVISSLTGITLHDEIDETMRTYQSRGEIILGIVPGMKPSQGADHGRETRVVSGTVAAGP